jgi:hypothetical protein
VTNRPVCLLPLGALRCGASFGASVRIRPTASGRQVQGQGCRLRVGCRCSRLAALGLLYDAHGKFDAGLPVCAVQRSAATGRRAVLDGQEPSMVTGGFRVSCLVDLAPEAIAQFTNERYATQASTQGQGDQPVNHRRGAEQQVDRKTIQPTRRGLVEFCPGEGGGWSRRRSDATSITTVAVQVR